MANTPRFTIVGTGCIGTSIGLALHQMQELPYVVGHDKELPHANAARRLKAIDKADWNLISACENADIVILALPMSGIQETLRAMASYLKPGCVVTDTASLKGPVVRWAEDLLPEGVSFIGGNPLVVSNGSGPDAADVDLFRGNLYCITPAANAHPDAVALVSNLVALLGGQPYYLDAAEHDGLMAAVEYLPRAMALALAISTMHEAAWREMRKLAGGSFDRVSALLGEDPDELGSLLLANKDNLVHWLDVCAIALARVRDLVVQGEHEPLTQLIEQAVMARRQWLQDRNQKYAEIKPPEIERTGLMRQLFIGRRRGS